MKIKLLTSRAGNAFCQNVGDEIEVSEAEAIRMIEAGQAVPVVASKRETATKKQVTEKAIKS